MFNRTEIDEREYLTKIKDMLRAAIDRIDSAVAGYTKELQEQKDYLWEHRAGMDHVEKVAVRQSVTRAALTGEAAVEKKKRLQKLISSPWFGRLDFREEKEKVPSPVYIGVHAWYDEERKENIIYDWRSPVSTMFYDFELGTAGYKAPKGYVEGEITVKRQYRIRNGQMEYMLESSLNIHDDILQQELSKASDDRMKHIVATIQRNQNAIIRDETSPVLIIQGVAGSGKTSIALHRVAFLLYRFRDTIASKDILILSPNKVFADYISGVLPELGEEKIPEKGMEELARELIDNKYRFQTFFDQVNLLHEKNDEGLRERIRFKANSEFTGRLNQYITHIENNYFNAETLVVKRYPVPATYVEEKFRTLHRIPLFERFNEIVNHIERDLQFYNNYTISAKERNDLRRSVKNMFRITNLRNLYIDFFKWMEKEEMFRYARGSVWEYSDLFPLIYLRLRMEGIKPFDNVKHLLVDEMQDYTAVQYAVLARLFPCRKTILGDAGQIVNESASSDSEAIAAIFPGASCMKLTKSYRSTSEIARFAQKIRPDSEMEVVDRHGEKPSVRGFKTRDEEFKAIRDTIDSFKESGFNSLGIVCKTRKQADHMHKSIKEYYPKAVHLSDQSNAFSNGIVVTSVHMAKGLEFDHVIVPGTDSRNYSNEEERGLLYIACTRAMHRLSLMYVKECTPFMKE
ncbi:MAG: AAA family ATPase [Bacteroidales bacterium]|nr:AAA family ATPase [Bacteroidales bacterium]